LRQQRTNGYPAVFEPQHALQEFVRVLTGRGLAKETLNLVDGCEALFDFYRDMRPLGQAFERHEDADMLLFQWGTYDWGEGEHFSLNLTRQLIFGEEAADESIWQLSLTFEFEPDVELKRLSSGDRWCGSVLGLAEFRDYVHASAAFTACARYQIRRRSLDYACGG
jgi:hypothetical protein